MTESRRQASPDDAENGDAVFRKRAMALLARADADELSDALAAFREPEASDLRAPETGLVMVRGRIGGGGAPFNLGEATVTRASVKLETGEIGHAYALGSYRAAARRAAVLDALFQRDGRAAAEAALAPIAERLGTADDRSAGEAAATKVNFFTMVRGDD